MRISDWSSDVCSSDLELADIEIDVAERGKRAEILRRERIGGIVIIGRGEGVHRGGIREVQIIVLDRVFARVIAADDPAQRAGIARKPRFGGKGRDLADHRDVAARQGGAVDIVVRSEEHTSELQSLMRLSYAVFCLKKT